MSRLSSATSAVALLVAACIALSTHTAHAVYTVEECNRYFQCPAPFAFSLGARGECQCCPQGGGGCAFPEALCYNRPNNCAECGPGGECTRCNMGYQLSGSTCIANACNVDLCSLCDANSRCIQCKKGYTLQGNTCVRSTYTLDECEGLYACPQGNKLMNGFGNCYCCDENELCNFAEAKCPQHPEHCAVCKLGSTSECIGCKPGYYLEEGANKCAPLCLAKNCQECEENSSSQCKKCDAGYWVENQSKQCHRLCFPYGCVKCRDGSSYECEVCQYGCKLRPDLNNVCQCPG